jgi:hypothetical protein
MRTWLAPLLLVAACSKAPTGAAPASPATARLGAPIAATTRVVALAEVVKNPAAYKGAAFVTTGTVTAVCQARGCWMEIKDDTSAAHIKMAGEQFFVPRTSAGHKARVQGTLDEVAGGDVECAQEAATQTGGQIAKLQLTATGVELD